MEQDFSEFTHGRVAEDGISTGLKTRGRWFDSDSVHYGHRASEFYKMAQRIKFAKKWWAMYYGRS